MSEPAERNYALTSQAVAEAQAPDLPYRPPMPRDRGTGIALFGAGGISGAHLEAYQRYGLNVLSIGSRDLARATGLRDAFFPQADATDDFERLLRDPRIVVLDITTHPEFRVDLMRRALAAGKHVLSQKPFVEDLAAGRELVEEAERRGVKLAVNQNGRWAPHLAWLREAVAAGLIGEVTGVHVAIRWNHGWISGTPFEAVDDLVLWDFGIHWFDFLVSVIGDRALRVHATTARAAGQTVRPPIARASARVVRRRAGLADIRRRHALWASGFHRRHRRARHGFQPRAGPRRAIGRIAHRSRRRAARPRGKLVQRRLRGRDGRIAVRDRGGPRDR